MEHKIKDYPPKNFRPVEVTLKFETIDELMSFVANLNVSYTELEETNSFPEQWDSEVHKYEPFLDLYSDLDDLVIEHFESK
jgi:hypothetical protein